MSKLLMNRLIPLPKKVKMKEGIILDCKRVDLFIDTLESPITKRIEELLNCFKTTSYFDRDFYINFAIFSEKEKTSSQFKKAKYKEQAYAIIPEVERGVFKGLNIRAFSELGLLNGARTLGQSFKKEDGKVDIPIIEVYDWPDVEFRGEWGWNTANEIPTISSYKLNAVDGKVFVNVDEELKPIVEHDDLLYKLAEENGVDVSSTISHLEGIAKSGNLSKFTEILSVPSEERASRSDYYPSMCLSNPKTKEMIVEWFKEIISNEKVKKILIWLSEDATTCHCDLCKGNEPYEIEVNALLDAYYEIRKINEDIKFGLMLSQGSFSENEKIAKMLPKDVTLTYYDGGRTYDSGQYEMILPSLKKYIDKGGKLGVYPQITHSWRVAFPMLSPYFIKYRCDEFTKKNVNRVIAYAIPTIKYHNFNTIALAEWLWNNDGRDIKSFVHAYAYNNDIDKDLFYSYIKTMENPSWDLAHSKIMLKLLYAFNLTLKSEFNFRDCRFEMADIKKIKKLDDDIKKAKKAIIIAKELKEVECICESECVLAGLYAYKGVMSFQKAIDNNKMDKIVLFESYDYVKTAAKRMYKYILKWNDYILNEDEVAIRRVMDTASVLFRILDGFDRELLKEGIELPKNNYRETDLEIFDEEDFKTKTKMVKEIDISNILHKKGSGIYHATFDYIQTQSGLQLTKINIFEISNSGSKVDIASTKNKLNRLAVWEPWSEYRLKVKKVNKNSKYVLHIEGEGRTKGEDTCKGMIGIRKVK